MPHAPFELWWARYHKRGRTLHHSPREGGAHMLSTDVGFDPSKVGRVYVVGGFGPLGYTAWDWYFPWLPPHKRTITDIWI